MYMYMYINSEKTATVAHAASNDKMSCGLLHASGRQRQGLRKLRERRSLSLSARRAKLGSETAARP